MRVGRQIAVRRAVAWACMSTWLEMDWQMPADSQKRKRRAGVADAIADRVAAELAPRLAPEPAPVLSAEEREALERIRSDHQRPVPDHDDDCPICKQRRHDRAVLDRLLGVAAIADRVAAELAAPASAPVLSIGLPPRKEWNAARYDHGDTNEAESSDYVDGWNDALDAVEASAPVLSAEDRGALVAVHCVANDAANRTPKGTFRDRLFLGVVALDRLLGGG